MDVSTEWRAFKATVVASFKIMMRYQTPSEWLLWRLANPLFSLATTVVIYFMLVPSGYSNTMVKYTGTSDFVAYIIIGGIVYAFTFNVLFGIGVSLYQEQENGTMGVLLLTPMNRFTWMIAQTMIGLFDTFLIVIIILTYAFFIFGIQFSSSVNLGLTIVSMILTIISLYALGIILDGISLITKQPWMLANTINPSLYFICGVNYPINVLPDWCQLIAKGIPLTYGIDAVRKTLLFGASFESVSFDLVMLLFFSIILNITAYFTFRYLEVVIKKKATVETY